MAFPDEFKSGKKITREMVFTAIDKHSDYDLYEVHTVIRKLLVVPASLNLTTDMTPQFKAHALRELFWFITAYCDSHAAQFPDLPFLDATC